MAEKAEIEIVIGPDGKARMLTRGLKGQSCVDETQTLEKALGKVVKREKTSEFYQQAAGTKSAVRGR